MNLLHYYDNFQENSTPSIVSYYFRSNRMNVKISFKLLL